MMGFRRQGGKDSKSELEEALVNRLMSSTGLDVIRNTIIVEMRVLAESPERAREWCDAMAQSYVELNFEAKKSENAAGAAAISSRACRSGGGFSRISSSTPRQT